MLCWFSQFNLTMNLLLPNTQQLIFYYCCYTIILHFALLLRELEQVPKYICVLLEICVF
jgi:hypothetical protein